MGKSRSEILEKKSIEKKWNPLPLDFLVEKYSLKDRRVQSLISIWVLLVIACITSVLLLSPSRVFMGETGQQSLYRFFLMYPPLFLGTLLLFWLGFEWAFIPVFLSAFLIAHSSGMMIHWALLFGGAFILGLGIFAVCYYSISISPRLDSLKRIAFFTSVAFVAALASSLGSFVWSLYHNLNATATIAIWKGWWTGTFLQSLLIVGPLLYFFTPSVDRVKAHFFSLPESKVTLKWIYTAILSVAVVLILFILGANILGAMGMEEEMAKLPAQFRENFTKVTDSFQIVSWISVGLVMAAGMGGIYLVGSWNKRLKEKVQEQTEQLKESEDSLKNALAERDRLLQKVNYRVKDNFTMVLALLELQLKTGDQKSVEETLKDSHARLRSLALVYETMHQTEAIDYLNLKQYCLKLSNRLSRSYKQEERTIDVRIEAYEVEMEIERAVPLAMILNELLVNAYVHGFKEGRSGTIFVEITKGDNQISLIVRDNGIGLPGDFDPSSENSLGMKLIMTLTRQLQGELNISKNEITEFNVTIPVEVAELGEIQE